MDKRKSYYLTIDTETCNDMENPIVYDIGGCIHDRKGNVEEAFSFVIYDTFVGMADVMTSAYYAEKIPNYEDDLQNGLRKMVTYATARAYIKELCDKYNVKAIIAHNMRFDYRATATTQRYLTKSKYRYFFPYGIELWDTMKMAQDTICKEWGYREWCKSNGYLTKNGQVRKTAEILYRYISGQNDFVESHTGLEDVMIEKEIFSACMAKHKKMNKYAFGQAYFFWFIFRTYYVRKYN